MVSKIFAKPPHRGGGGGLLYPPSQGFTGGGEGVNKYLFNLFAFMFGIVYIKGIKRLHDTRGHDGLYYLFERKHFRR